MNTRARLLSLPLASWQAICLTKMDPTALPGRVDIQMSSLDLWCGISAMHNTQQQAIVAFRSAFL